MPILKQKDVDEYNRIRNRECIYRTLIQDLREYLHSDKFGKDIMVNKNDILLRISEYERLLNEC